MRPRKITIISYIVSILSLVSVSCDKGLDFTPTDSVAKSTAFNDPATADLFLADIYNSMQDGNANLNTDAGSEPFDNFTDNGVCGYGWGTSLTDQFWRGAMNPSDFGIYTSNIPNDWTTIYTAIRKCNVFLQGVSESATLPEDYKKVAMSEARFIRAYFYQYLWMEYGGVPLITIPLDLSTQGDSTFYPRATTEATYDFIEKELDEISQPDFLPDIPKETGRITRGAALTLKGWIELFNHDFAKAAATNKQVIDGNVYSLFPKYQALFLPENNDNVEGVLYRKYYPRVHGGTIEGLWAIPFTQDGANVAYGGANPTQELVDDYCMSNGKPITDPTSGYDPQNPYKNREKRFYESIVYDGSPWYVDTAVYFRLGINSPNEIDLENVSYARTKTGYGLRKRLDEKINFLESGWYSYTANGIGSQDFYIFRYAEVLLNYAEAQNETIGPDASVIAAIDKIRERGGIPSLSETFGSLSQDQMREVIRRERRVELAFEDKRYWDLIRWRLAETKLSGYIHAMKITADGSGNLNYAVVPIESLGERSFTAPKNYLFPIPQAVLEANSKLTQNPGY